MRSLLKAVLGDEDRGDLDRGEMSAIPGGDQKDIDLASPGNNNDAGNSDVVVVGVTIGGGGLDGEGEMTVSSEGGGITDDRPLQGREVVAARGAFSWESLAAPASRLYAACRPFDPAQLDVLDDIIGDVYRHR